MIVKLTCLKVEHRENPWLNPMDEQNTNLGEWHGCHSKNVRCCVFRLAFVSLHLFMARQDSLLALAFRLVFLQTYYFHPKKFILFWLHFREWQWKLHKVWSTFEQSFKRFVKPISLCHFLKILFLCNRSCC